MSLRFASQLNVDALPAEALNSEFEVIMPALNVILESKGGKSLNGSDSLLDTAKNFISGAISKVNDVIGAGVSYNYTPIVEAIQFKPRSFKIQQRRIRTQWINVAEDLDNLSTIQIIMFCSNGMLTQYYLDAWRGLVFNSDGEYYNPMSIYKKNIEVYFYGAASVGSFIPVAHFTLKGCFPVSQGVYNLKYSNKPDRITITTDFSVDRIVTDMTLAKASALRELIASPLSVADKLFQTLSSGVTDYGVSDTTD